MSTNPPTDPTPTDATVSKKPEDSVEMKPPPTITFILNIISIFAAKPASETKGQKSDSERNDAEKPLVKAAMLAKLPIQAPNATDLRAQMTLAKLKAQLMKSYPRATPFRFCTENGEVALESMNLDKYFASLNRQPGKSDASFNIYVTAINSGDPNQSVVALLKHSGFCLKFMRLVDANNSSIEGSLDSAIFKGKDAARTSMNTLRSFVKTMSVDSKQDTFCLPDGTPIQDGISLEQYLGMAKPAISEKDKVPTIAIFFKKSALPVIQPTSGLLGGSWGTGSSDRAEGQSGGQSDRQSKSTGIDQSVIDKLGKLDLAFTDRSKEELHRNTARLQVNETLHEKDYAAASGGTAVHANKLNENEWDLILKNCNAFCGWIIDFKGNKINRAPHAAFKLRRGLNLEKVTMENLPIAEDPTDAPPPYTKSSDAAEASNEHKPAVVDKKLQPLQPKDVKEYMPRKPQGIPSFSITDDTSIEVAAVKHEFSMSMAENHFDKTIFEAEASGSFKGITAGAQGGLATESQRGIRSSEDQVSKTLVATYKIPRATIYLSAEDLEPTDEFVAAIEQVRNSHNIVDLRRLHRMFGQIYCTEIIIGGCLQTSKTLEANESSTERLARNKFKGSVGLAVGFPKLGSASMKASHETQDHSESGSRTFDQREALSFNATGGNTILAANPPAWLTSVGSDFNNWRVIQQGELRPVMDVVSDIEGYGDVRMWFLQAAPKLTEYIIIPQSRTIDARFKVTLNSEGLAKAFEMQADVGLVNGKTSTKIQTYLAHDPEKPPVHVRTYVKRYEHAQESTPAPVRFENLRPIIDITNRIYQTTETSTHAIFQPVSTQSAVLLDPRAHGIQTSKDSTPAVDKRTVWTMEVPYGYSLRHGSLVTLKSQAKETPGMALTLTVYRNAQGVFMPSITSNPEPIYWRVLKVNRGHEPDSDQIKFGDAVRLCWRFSDQPSGWRDYADDFYGRRRFDRPAELRPEQDTLYFKIPFPRFEGLNDSQGISLLLSTASNTGPILETLTLREPSQLSGTEQVTYNLFDLSFRLDYVGNGGLGEAFDYMNVVRDEDSFSSVKDMKKEWKTHQEQSAGEIGGRIVNNFTSTYVKQFDGLANAVTSGSPGSVAKEALKTVARFTPLGMAASLFGF